jgi:hypothetical protein
VNMASDSVPAQAPPGELMRMVAARPTGEGLDESTAPVPVPPTWGRVRPGWDQVPATADRVPPGWDRVSRLEAEWPVLDFLERGALPGAVPSARLHARSVLREWALARSLRPSSRWSRN